ncbi:MAG TPA: nucleotidyltransferase domain-containing protein [Gaiellaceae bacterium]|nr:nucleotidyltransferase domain-containing protein [Gaiellaceae bacterium]
MLDELLARARADGNVVGVAVFGSRAYGLHLHERSDWDVLVAVRELGDHWVSEHGDPVELVQLTLGRVADPPDWFRPALLHADVRLDETGELAEALAAATRVDPAGAAEPLDGYVNMLYRSLKNARAGLGPASLLDAQESIPWLLRFLFAVHGRVRPYNKWLEWELEHHPLPTPSNSLLLGRLERIARTGAVEEQRALFLEVEALARGHGHGATIDGWEPDVAFLRGE